MSGERTDRRELGLERIEVRRLPPHPSDGRAVTGRLAFVGAAAVGVGRTRRPPGRSGLCAAHLVPGHRLNRGILPMSSHAGTATGVADALARQVEARQGAESVWVEALRELGAVDRAVYQAVADTPAGAGCSGSQALERGELLAAMACCRRRNRRARRQARAARRAGGCAGDRGDLGGGQSRYKTACPAAPPGSHRLRQVCGSPRTDAGIDLLPVRPRRVGVRVRLRGRQAPAGLGSADPAAGERRRLLASPHWRALSRRRGHRLRPGSRNRGNGRGGMRPHPSTAGPGMQTCITANPDASPPLHRPESVLQRPAGFPRGGNRADCEMR